MAQTLPGPQTGSQRQLEPAEGRDSPKRLAKIRRLLPLGLAVVGAGAAAWYFFSRPESDALEFSGRIEGYETDIGAKVPGRVIDVTVREGAEVRQGQLLVKLDDDEIQAQVAGAEARIRAAKQQEQNARLQLSVIESQITEAELRWQQSKGDTTGRISQAEAQVATATAQLKQAEAQAIEAQAQLNLARTDRDRYAQLVQDGAVTQQQYDQRETTYQAAQATLESRQAAVAAAQRQVNAAQGNLTQSQTTSLNPDINTAQLNRLTTQLKQAQAELKAAQAEVANVEAERNRIQAQLKELTINSPINGVVTSRSVEPGVVVTAGKTLLSVLDLNTVYMRGFIPQGDIGNVRVGQTARVYLDSNPDQPLNARVAAVDAEASFTPENIYFKKDRVQQVFGVRLAIEEPGGFAKPGMPADAEILVERER
ncbi:HlyD family secretion protein [Leptolyngbya sp. NK1-12]|uniref:HlyD family secretion protein n=1 Tax=Leptolyngbya sp. NK1-12 TaxID=2547451 RepID=A0AA96WBK2_9CYAN|nr:HlyD family secretion protein [Leptolyngbya sp. NK1-12]